MVFVGVAIIQCHFSQAVLGVGFSDRTRANFIILKNRIDLNTGFAALIIEQQNHLGMEAGAQIAVFDARQQLQ